MGVTVRALLAVLTLWAGVQDKPALPPEPDASAQKDTLKQLKDLFKDDYAKKSPADQASFAQKLLQKGIATGDDLATKFVLLKEARDIASGVGDADTALRAATELSRAFAVDGPALKLAVLTKMAATIHDPEAARSLAKSCQGMVAEAVRADGYETAIATLTRADALAKTAQDSMLAARLQELRKEVGSLKDEHTRVKPMLEKPGTGDEDAIGRYLCFVKGDWDTGLPHLVAGAKAPLKGVVEKDVLNPVEADKQVELADAWAEVAQKEKSAWRKSRIQTRVRYWLEKALPSGTGVLKMKIEKKLGDLEEVDPAAVNLLRLVDVKVDAIGGEWTMENGVLQSGPQEWARIQLPYTPPDEYELTLVVNRKEGVDSLGVGLGQGKTAFALWIDGHPAKGGMSGLDLLDGVLMENNPASVTGKFLENNRPSTIVITVRKSGVSVAIDGKSVLTWQGAYSRLAKSPVWQQRDPKAPLLVGAFGSRYQFTKISLTPLSGQGKKLR